MRFFDFFTKGGGQLNKPAETIIKSTKSGDLESELFRTLSYIDCQNLYSFIPLAKRIINLPIKIAMNNINISFGKDNKYKDIEELNNIDINYVKTLCTEYISKVRLYGYSILLPIISDKDDISKVLMKDQLYGTDIRYNILDPLNVTVDIDRDPSSYSYKKITNIRISQGKMKQVYSKRVLALQNNLNNQYLQYNRASYNYIGLSELQVAFPLINLLTSTLTSMERQLLHSSIMVLEQDSSTTNINTQALVNQSASLNDTKQDSVIILNNGLKLNQFQLQNMDSISNVITNINKLISLSIDIPTALFCDESVSNGFGDGSNESRIVEMYLSDIRNSLIIPTIKFILTHEVYNKVSDYRLATEIVDSIIIEFGAMFNQDEQLKSLDDMTEEERNNVLVTETNINGNDEDAVNDKPIKEKEEVIKKEEVK